jgi:hypothetical protein
MLKEVRNNDRVMFDDVDRAQDLYRRLSPHFGAAFHRRNGSPSDERLRLYRTIWGRSSTGTLTDVFERPTTNGAFSHSYFNEHFEGGTTSFTIDQSSTSTGGVVRVPPKTGIALLFHHPILHRGDPVIAGRKYVLRTDAMYGPRMRVVETDALAPDPIGYSRRATRSNHHSCRDRPCN